MFTLKFHKKPFAASIFFFLIVIQAHSQQAEVIYKTYCGGCHGARLEGNSAPGLVKDKWLHGSTRKNRNGGVRFES